MTANDAGGQWLMPVLNSCCHQASCCPQVLVVHANTGRCVWPVCRHCVTTQQVGVSAGGWLARLALGSVPYNGEVFNLAPKVHTLVTLGTPHLSLEDYPFGRAEVRQQA